MKRPWVFAAKPASWPKLLVPFFLGQAIGLAGPEAPSAAAFGLGLAFTVLDLLFIVFLNDWGDREVDAIKRRMFPKSSKKTIPDGVLPARHLLFAGLAAGLGALGIAAAAHLLLDRPWLVPLAVLALGIFVAYSLPPARLNYRGGGELLEMVGVAIALPALQAYLQGGAVLLPGAWLLPGFALLSLASAVASGLSDERSDRAGGKRTFVAAFGNRAGRLATEGLAFAGALAWGFAATVVDALPFWIPAAGAAVAFFYGGVTVASSRQATTDAFGAQRRYKQALHRAIWRGAATAAMLLALWHLL